MTHLTTHDSKNMTCDFKLMCCLANVVKIPKGRADTLPTASYTAFCCPCPNFGDELLLSNSKLANIILKMVQFVSSNILYTFTI